MSKSKNIFIGLLLSLLAISCVFIGVFANSTTLADEPTVEYKNGGSIESEYDLGYTLVVPQAQIVVDETRYDATSQTLVFPNGKVYRDASYVLSVPGKYLIKYSAKVNGKTVTVTDGFMVKAGAFSVSGTNSSAYYGNTGERGDFDGIIVSLAPNDVFTYEKVIDLRDKNKADMLLNLYAIPERQGISDVTTLYVRITDAYDENNYVDIATFASRANPNEVADDGKEAGAIYSAAGAHNQTLTGAHWWSEDVAADHDCIKYEDGEYYAIRKNITNRSGNGYPSKAFSFSARNGYGAGIRKTQTSGYTLAFDYAQKKLYGCTPNSSPSNGLIADLDDSLFFDNLWTGFTNGEVKISVFADNYANSTFNFVVTKIYDEDLSANAFSVSKQPEIVVNYPNGTNVPTAICNQPYKIFSATAYSVIDGVKPCKALVYKDYYSTSKKFVNVNENGEFIPTDTTAPYHIVYSYTDTFGNIAVEVVEINVIPQSNLNISLGNGENECFTGETISLKYPTVQGANGEYQLKVLVGTDEFTEITADEYGNYLFTPLYAGNYTVKYIVNDYTSEKETEYPFNVTTNQNPVALDEPLLPVTFVKDASYVLANLDAYEFTDGEYKTKLADVSYKFDDGAEQNYSRGSSIKITAVSTVTVIYSANGKTLKTCIVPVTDVGVGNGSFVKANYFYGTAFAKQSNEGEDFVRYTTSADNATLDFVKPLLMNEFSWRFGFDFVAFKNMNIMLTDTQNPNNVLKISIGTLNDSEVTLQVNDGEVKKLYLSIASDNHTLKYDRKTNKVFLDKYSCDVTGFDGFEELTATMQVKFIGVSGLVELKAYNLNGTSLDSTTSDYVAPTYYLDIDSGSKKLGEYIVISNFYVEDVIRFNTSASLTIKDAKDNVCTAEDGTVMNNITDFSREYKIKVTSLGKYTVTAKCSDGENDAKITLYIYSVDRNAPKITLDDGYATTCTLGKSFKVATVTVTDNIDKELTIKVMVMNPYGKVTLLNGADSYVPATTGTYTVLYRVTDSDGNVTTTHYEVSVKQGE